MTPSAEKGAGPAAMPSSASASSAWARDAFRVFTRSASGGTALFARQIAMVSSPVNWASRRLTSQGGWEWRAAIAFSGSFAVSGQAMPSFFRRAFRRTAFTSPEAAGARARAISTASLTAAKGGIRSVKKSW